MEIHIFFGPTATSKTKLAQSLWEKTHFPILSVDSRKVYKGADIGTNKLALLEFCHSHPDVLVGGIDFKQPNETINAFEYQHYVYQWIAEHEKQLQQSGGLIIHGGTGLYLDAILEGKSFLSPGNVDLRTELQELSLEQLQQRAQTDDSAAFARLNESDRNNPRRLMRVIENTGVQEIIDPRATFFKTAELVWHMAIPDRQVLYEVIDSRVLKYIEQGWLAEVETLVAKWGTTATALHMMGYKQIVAFMQTYPDWRSFVEQKAPEFALVLAAIQQEHRRYAKRQITWARKYQTLL